MRETPWHREDPVDALERREQRIADTTRWSDMSYREATPGVHAPDCPHSMRWEQRDHFADEMDDAAEAQERRDHRALS